jgi:hypothetical protein
MPARRKTIDADIWRAAVKFVAKQHPQAPEIDRMVYLVAEPLQRQRNKQTTIKLPDGP